MSIFTDTLTGLVRISRFTANVVDKKVMISSPAVDRQPAQSCRLAVEISGVTVTAGTISIAGTTTESFNFSENRVKVGLKDFSNISGISAVGLTSGYIEIRAVSKTGQPINQEINVHTNIPARFFPMKSGARRQVKMMPAGQQKMAQYVLLVEASRDIQENDVMYAISGIPGLTRGQVMFVEHILDFDGITHHIEAEIAGI
jgi:hypothetical protein